MSGYKSENEKAYHYQTTFHSSPPFFSCLAIFHSPHAKAQLPNVPHIDNTNASTPNVGNDFIICSLLPTSMPSMNSSVHISHVVVLPAHVPIDSCLSQPIFVRMIYPTLIPRNMNNITMNISFSLLSLYGIIVIFDITTKKVYQTV